MLELDSKTRLHLIVVLELKSQFVQSLIVSGGALSNRLAQVQVFDDLRKLQLLVALGNLLHLVLTVLLSLLEVDGHKRRLDVRGSSHQDFLQARDTKSHVSTTVTCQMERVQCHLRRRLSDRLSCDSADIFARVHHRLLILHVVHLLEIIFIYHSKLVLWRATTLVFKLLAERVLLHIVTH